jgi:dihydroorotase
MTLYHSAQITPAVIEQIARSTVVYAIKRYPLSRVNGKEITTNSSHGIPLDHPLVHEQFVAMEATGVPYLGHFEDDTDKYNRPLPPIEGERQAILETGRRLRDKYKNLKICVEHASVKEAVHFVRSDGSGLTAMTITPHHPTFTLKDYELYGDDLRCKPSIQTEENRNEIWSFMVSGDSRTIAGNDDARHLRSKKKAGATGCALPHSIAMYAARFRDAGALDHRFVRFMCVNGPMWWGLPLPDAGDTITLHVDRERDLPEPTLVPSENDIVTPLGWHEDKAKCFHPGFVVDRPSF